MTTLITGATGYIGSYVAAGLLERGERLALLVRASSPEEAERRLWAALQIHMEFDLFEQSLRDRVDVVVGDLTSPRLGLDLAAYRRLVEGTDSVVHVAASLNRRSAKTCFNVNLRGTLELIQLARAAHADHGIRRFSDVSTAWVSGRRSGVTVAEDDMVDWRLSDYDPYARTKKFAEHMIGELLADVPVTVFRPSTVLGDSRFPETTQFDMVRAFVFLADLPVLPFAADWRMDIVPADFVGRTIVALHTDAQPRHRSYNLTSGNASPTFADILDAMVAAGHRHRPRFAPALLRSSQLLAALVANTPRRWGVSSPGGLLQVFLPYLACDTVFENSRVVSELGAAPERFVDYAPGLYHFARDGGFRYPYRPWPRSP